jgi:hypothetical protein
MRTAIGRGRVTAVAMLAACALALPAISSAQSTDPLVGTWKMDTAKSTFKPGPASTSSTLVIEAAGKGMKVSVDAVTANGPLKWNYTAMPDGKTMTITQDGVDLKGQTVHNVLHYVK